STRPPPGRGRAISSGATSAPDDRPARPARLLRHVRTAELFAPAHHLLTDSLGDHPGSALPVPGPGPPGAGAAGAGALRLRADPAGVRGTVRADAGDPAARPGARVLRPPGGGADHDLRCHVLPGADPRRAADRRDRGAAGPDDHRRADGGLEPD